MKDDPEFALYKKKTASLVKRQEKITQELILLSNMLKLTCSHPEHHQEKRSSYTSGGYDYQSRSNEWVQCTRCNQVISDIKTTLGGFE